MTTHDLINECAELFRAHDLPGTVYLLEHGMQHTIPNVPMVLPDAAFAEAKETIRKGDYEAIKELQRQVEMWKGFAKDAEADAGRYRAPAVVLWDDYAALERERDALRADLTACRKALAWSEQRIEQLLEQNTQAMESLRIIAGERQGAGNLMSDKDIARQALRRVKP